MSGALIPIQDVEKMAEAVAKSNLFGAKTKEQAFALMMIAQAEGMHPAMACQQYDIIQGRPALKATAILGRFQQAGGKVVWKSNTDTEVSGEFSHPQAPEPLLISWTIDRAKKAGLASKDNWIKYPRQMLRARVITEGVRACFPASCSGFIATEEAQDEPEVIKTEQKESLNTVEGLKSALGAETAVLVVDHAEKPLPVAPESLQLPPTVENGKTDVESKKSLKKPLNANSASQLFGKMKFKLGQEIYYTILGTYGVEHYTQLSVNDRKKCYEEMADRVAQTETPTGTPDEA